MNWCGNGKEGNLNSNMGLKVAKLAQPSGLSFSQDSLFFAVREEVTCVGLVIKCGTRGGPDHRAKGV